MRVLREAQGPSPYELKRAAAASGSNRGGGGNRREWGSSVGQSSGGGAAAVGGVRMGMGAGVVATASAESQAPPQGKEHHFEEVEIGILRECLQWEFSELVGESGDQTQGRDCFSLACYEVTQVCLTFFTRWESMLDCAGSVITSHDDKQVP